MGDQVVAIPDDRSRSLKLIHAIAALLRGDVAIPNDRSRSLKLRQAGYAVFGGDGCDT